MNRQWDKALLFAGWDLRKAIELAATIERMGEEHYRALATKWDSSDSLGTLFAKLAGEEAGHREGVETLLSSAPRNGAVSELDEECLRAIAHAFFFSEDGGALRGIEGVAAREQVLEKVLRFENATLHFYRGLRDVLGPSPVLDSMIEEEKRHAVEIMRAITGTRRDARTPQDRHQSSSSP